MQYACKPVVYSFISKSDTFDQYHNRDKASIFRDDAHFHDDIFAWTSLFYLPFVRGIYQSTVHFSHKEQLMRIFKVFFC